MSQTGRIATPIAAKRVDPGRAKTCTKKLIQPISRYRNISVTEVPSRNHSSESKFGVGSGLVAVEAYILIRNR